VYCADSYAYTFYAASLISGSGVEKVRRLIEVAAAQADEVDEKYLQVLHFCSLSCFLCKLWYIVCMM